MARSDWKLDKMTSSYVEDSILWDDIMGFINNDNDSKDPKVIALQLVVEISRNTKILEKLFYIPLMRMFFYLFFLIFYKHAETILLKIAKKKKIDNSIKVPIFI